MKIDAFSFILGALAVFLLGFVFMKRKSFFEQSPFQDTMTEAEARQIMENMTQEMRQKFEAKTSPSEAEVKEFQDSLVKLTSDFSAFMTRKSIQAPAAPEAPAAPQTTTSTFKPESYY